MEDLIREMLMRLVQGGWSQKVMTNMCMQVARTYFTAFQKCHLHVPNLLEMIIFLGFFLEMVVARKNRSILILLFHNGSCE